MFYSEAILSRRGPLARVWLAAHMERKLSKTQTLQTDIEQATDAIIGQEIEVMALRLSGQLLLGVVRIYSRKAKYLLDDCNEALLKIKMAFKPGIVDMTEDQLAVNRNAITLQGNELDLDALLPDINWNADYDVPEVRPGGQHIARTADITLRTTDDYQFSFSDDYDALTLGPPDGIGSQDFDLGIDFGDDPPAPAPEERERSEARSEDESIEIEYAREAAPPRPPRESLASILMGRPSDDMDVDVQSHRSREPSEHPFDADMDIAFGPDIDLGIDFGDKAPSEHERTPRLTPSRASSPLTPPPATPPPDVELTPRADAEAEMAKGRKKPERTKLIIDERTELANGPGATLGRGRQALGSQQADVSGIVTEHGHLPRSAVVMRLQEIFEDPIAHFLPTRTTASGTFFVAGPPGLAPELAQLFMRPVQSLSAPKRRGSPEREPTPKRARLEGSIAGEEEDEVEQARRAESAAPSAIIGSDILGGRSSMGPELEFDQSGMMDDFQMPELSVGDVQLPGVDAEQGQERAKSVLSELTQLSRLSTPVPENALFDEGEETYADAACPIASFDERGAQAQDGEQEDGKGYSKNTVKAMRIIRQELQPTPVDEGEKAMSFRRMADKATRRAASSFFFELLVLGTRDCVKLTQEEPYANIEVRAKPKLWERQRHTSVAPSVSSALQPGTSQHSQTGSAGPSPLRQGSVAPSIASVLGL